MNLFSVEDTVVPSEDTDSAAVFTDTDLSEEVFPTTPFADDLSQADHLASTDHILPVDNWLQADSPEHIKDFIGDVWPEDA